MSTYRVEYYTRANGHTPVAEWLDEIDREASSVVRAKIEALEEYGLELLQTNMLKLITGYGGDFFELVGRPCRVATYYDRSRGTFVLLCGWRKTKQNQREAIERACRLLNEYRST